MGDHQWQHDTIFEVIKLKDKPNQTSLKHALKIVSYSNLSPLTLSLSSIAALFQIYKIGHGDWGEFLAKSKTHTHTHKYISSLSQQNPYHKTFDFLVSRQK